MNLRGRFKLKLNVTYQLKDKFGNVKPIWQENRLHVWLMKQNIYSPLWPKIPFLLGNWSGQKLFSNLVTNAGKAAVASRINGDGAEAVFDEIGWGTGTTGAAAGDTALEAEKDAGGGASTTHVIGDATASRVTTDVTNDTARLVGTSTATGTIAITESGVFNANTAGTLLARQVFSAINVVSGDSIQFTWNFDVD